MRLLSLFLCAAAACPAPLEISRPARPWEFLDATGPQAAIFGQENGIVEAYVYPLKIVKDLRLRFRVDGRSIPAESIARRIVSRPGSCTLIYTGDDFEVREEFVAPIGQPGVLIRLQATAFHPLRIDVEFTRDFQLMWPASIGTAYAEWQDREKAFAFGADGQPYAAVLGSPDASLLERAYATNYSGDPTSAFSLGTIIGGAEKLIAIAASVNSREAALDSWRRLISGSKRLIEETDRYYESYLDKTVQLDLPDPQLQSAYDWSRISMVKGMVDNPLLGRGLVAGYGPSKGAYRPGFAWFFGRDSFWTSFAQTSAGDLANAREALAFIAKYQREDGKIPHEISQSASLVPWFQTFPYGYASADATPLFIIALRNYVEASGDIAFAREQSAHLAKAVDFMHATLDAAGFPRNAGIGHGWVEGGPLLPVDVELYQAGCYVEAIRSMASIAQLLGEAAQAKQFEQEFEAKRKRINELFWLPQSRTFAFALDTAAKPVDQPSVLAAVPMWFGVLDPEKSRAMIESLSQEEHAADWGMRILSSKSPLYGPEGYHYGSVWPLFTGWASVGEYRSHSATAGLANLRANAWLALDGAGGNTTEVLSGMSYSPLSTASPHQIWSAAMVISPLMRGLLGIEIDAARRRLTFAPHLPANWDHAYARNIPFGKGTIDLVLRRTDRSFELQVLNDGAEPLDIDFAPAYAPPAKVTRAILNGRPVRWKEERNDLDWHPHFQLRVDRRLTNFVADHTGWFGYSVPFDPPQLGSASTNLKVISEHWSKDGRQLELAVSGRPSLQYQLQVTGGKTVPVDMPSSPTEDYVTQIVRLKP